MFRYYNDAIEAEKTVTAEERAARAARRDRNAALILSVCCHLKAGESLVIVCHERNNFAHSGPSAECARSLARAAVEMGAYPMILDLDEYRSTSKWKEFSPTAPIHALFDSADVILSATGAYKRLSYPSEEMYDDFLVGRSRRFTLQPFMDLWDLDENELLRTIARTEKVVSLLDRSREVRVTCPAGTDFTCTLQNYTQILGIIPCYGEVATMPEYTSGNGRIVVMGPTQQGVRPFTETDREPLTLTVKDGVLQTLSGDPEQIARLEAFIHKREPYATGIDEVGIPTTRVPENDMCWSDGTHCKDTIHIALGNNQSRDSVVHGKLHMDMEIVSPTLYIGGEKVEL